MFSSGSGTPWAFVYSFPIRWPISPLRRRKPIPEQVKPFEGLRPPKPSRGRSMFISESGTPWAFVYSFPIRWPISPLRRRKPIPEQVKPFEGLRPPKPSRTRAIFTSDGHAHGAQRQNENTCSWEGAALPNPPRWRVVCWEGAGARPRRAPTPKPSRGQAIFTSAGTPALSGDTGREPRSSAGGRRFRARRSGCLPRAAGTALPRPGERYGRCRRPPGAWVR